jgi:hypothetical protein
MYPFSRSYVDESADMPEDHAQRVVARAPSGERMRAIQCSAFDSRLAKKEASFVSDMSEQSQ